MSANTLRDLHLAQSVSISETPEKQRLRQELAWTRAEADRRVQYILDRTQKLIQDERHQTKDKYDACVATLHKEWDVALQAERDKMQQAVHELQSLAADGFLEKQFVELEIGRLRDEHKEM